MGGSLIRRLIAALAAVSLLLAGFAATSVAADGPCGMAGPSMVAEAGIPCGHDGGGPDHPMPGTAAMVCFAKCPAPVLTLAPGLQAAAKAPPVLFAVRAARLAGILVAPPPEPPRA